ncbi:MAG TPA: T9SS type A sorting domain-containing protein, partial [Aquaticitalea sp.]|nr:T9SS type A sorting domain-containing protein [Aquaticitalea sp.]
LYPNPTSNRIYLQGIESETTIEVYSVEGRKLSTYHRDSSSYIDLGLPSGLYILNLISEGRTLTKKLILK